MNWITELELNKDKQELKKEKHHRGGNAACPASLGRGLWMDAPIWGQVREEPQLLLLLITCRPSEGSRCAAHRMGSAETPGASPVPSLVGIQERAPCSRAGGAQDTAQPVQSSTTRATITCSRLQWALLTPWSCPTPLLRPPGVDGCSSLGAAGACRGRHRDRMKPSG